MQMHIANATIHLTLPQGMAGIPSELLNFEPFTTATIQPAAAGNTLTPPAHGEYWLGQGGYYVCTLPALLDAPARHLIAGAAESEDRITYGPSIDVPGARSQLNGRTNTAALLATGKDHPAAEWATAYAADGHTDFFLPSRLDLVMAHICAPELFEKSSWYWSSTQSSRTNAFVQDFEGGDSIWDGKGSERRVRAFRWVQDLNA
ncbi:hypothetical protein SAMN05216344_10694 [Polaromonas sp. OV174]|uniref:DUF1566 domain-containing protein n=1 Tax=Polaromonas sp. OV174 TaxID=1855300 RepID=UPI0008E524DE|nr:DUF1566 domain-containing protein [Polaromonas sp. OV174]SFB95989.1 hypothetical protein SAMN05216344_10694 [Polaromonas sp. OV174]